MSTPTWQYNLYRRLLQTAQLGTVHRHGAYLAAGWLSLFRIRPPDNGAEPPSLSAIAGGGVVLLLLLLLAGPVLGAMQPVLMALGRVPPSMLLSALVLAFLLWRYRVGRKLLLQFETYVQCDGVAPSP